MTLDLGCLADVTQIRLKNTHNGVWANRGLKDFIITISPNNVDWNLGFEKETFELDETALQTNLKCFYNGAQMKFVEPELKSASTSIRPNLARYVHIETMSLYHASAGLSYVTFEVDNSNIANEYIKLDISNFEWFRWTYKTDNDQASYIECGYLCDNEGDICTMYLHYDGVCYLNNMRETHHTIITESPHQGISTGMVKKCE